MNVKTAHGKDFRVMLTPELAARLATLQEREGLEHRSALLAKLVDYAERLHTIQSVDALTFAEQGMEEYEGLSEAELVARASEMMPFKVWASKALVSEAKKMYRQTQETTASGGERQRTTRSQTYAAIDAAVRAQMARNEAAGAHCIPDTDGYLQQRNISTGWIQEAVGCNFSAVKEYMAIHGAEIERHHAQLGIHRHHNMRVVKSAKRAAKAGA
jgi:hypothetical protein